ncbi:hypothetical protein T11_10548 [Trichinella zimbabwensis]|uniref:Uncharacterized protein n=1 Tax=Trichinella zimbabwensis TaxID=268475 RepID=A0A0V1GWX4_9BILA|nr:hypothetical protein T11_10548 [Trichinella zimbabwensis]
MNEYPMHLERIPGAIICECITENHRYAGRHHIPTTGLPLHGSTRSLPLDKKSMGVDVLYGNKEETFWRLVPHEQSNHICLVRCTSRDYAEKQD